MEYHRPPDARFIYIGSRRRRAGMPVMNGEEMINNIREQPEWEELPIIVVSTEGSATRIERLQQKGAGFVHKPFTPEIVQAVMKEITGVSHEQTA